MLIKQKKQPKKERKGDNKCFQNIFNSNNISYLTINSFLCDLKL